MMQNLRKLELPHNDAGEVDWDTLGKILSAHILGEVLCASYVDYKYGRNSGEFEADTDWKFYYEEKGIMIFRKILKDSPINVFMGRGVVDLPIEEVVAYLENHERRHEWDKYLMEIQELKRISETDVIIRLILEAKHCLVKQHRELLLYERMKYIDGKYVRTTLSVDLPEFPPTSGIQRAEVRPGTGFVCEPFEGRKDKTLVTDIVHIDLSGLPVVIINQAMKRQPMCVYRIREMLTRSKTQKAGGRKSSKPRESLQESGEFCPGSRNSSQSLTYSEEVPIRDFLGLHSDSFQRCHSVPVEVYKADRLHNDHHPSSDEHNTLASNQERDVDDDQDCEATSATGQ